MSFTVTDPKNISKEFVFRSLFIEKHLSVNFADYIGKDPKKIFFGFDFENIGHVLYISYIENDNDDNEKFYEIDLSIDNDKSTILNELEDAVSSICKDVSAKISELMTNVGKLILWSDLMDVYRFYCDMDREVTKIYKCTDDNVVIAVYGDYASVFHTEEHTVDYLYDLFMACMDRHLSFALNIFFKKNGF